MATDPATTAAGFPLFAWLLALAGALLMLFGLALMLGAGVGWHPLLAESGAGVVFLVSGIALAGSAAFPMVLRRLAAQDHRAQ